MPIATCLFCLEVKPVGLFFRVCRECWQAERDPLARLDRVIEERGLVAPAGSLLYRPGEAGVRGRGSGVREGAAAPPSDRRGATPPLTPDPSPLTPGVQR